MKEQLYKKRTKYKRIAAFSLMFLLGSVITSVFSFAVSFTVGVAFFIISFMIYDDLDHTAKNK